MRMQPDIGFCMSHGSLPPVYSPCPMDFTYKTQIERKKLKNFKSGHRALNSQHRALGTSHTPMKSAARDLQSFVPVHRAACLQRLEAGF